MKYYMKEGSVYCDSVHIIPDGSNEVTKDQYELFVTCPPYHKWNGTEWIPDTTKKQELIAAIRTNIDSDTDAKILNDFKIEGKGFKLSLENQMNYKAV